MSDDAALAAADDALESAVDASGAATAAFLRGFALATDHPTQHPATPEVIAPPAPGEPTAYELGDPSHEVHQPEDPPEGALLEKWVRENPTPHAGPEIEEPTL